MSETVNIRLPGVVDLTQYRVQVGDTVAFIEKINSTQTDLENWAQQLTFCAADLQSAADQIGTRHAEIVQTGTQVAEDKDTVQQLRTETGQDRQAAEQSATTAGQHLTAAVQERQAAGQAATTAGQHLTATAQERQAAEQAATTASQHLTATAQERQAAEQAAQQAAQSAVEAGPTNLSVTRTATTVTVQSSTGDDAVLPAASETEAGMMTAADKELLKGRKGYSSTGVSPTGLMAYNGVTRSSGYFYGGSSTPTQRISSYRMNYDGPFRVPDLDVVGSIRGSRFYSSTGSNFTLSLHSYSSFILTLSGNATLNNPNGRDAGRSGIIVINSTGSITLSFGSYWKFPDGPPNLSEGSSVDVIAYWVKSSSEIICNMIKDVN